MGIGVSFGRRGGCYIVANYYPKMHLNSLPRFLRNVHPPLTPSSVPREEQYELWCSLRNTHLQHEVSLLIKINLKVEYRMGSGGERKNSVVSAELESKW